MRRVVSLFGLCVMCLCSQGAFGQVDGPRDPPPGPAELVVTAESGDGMTPTIYHLAIAGDPKTAGAMGVFYRTTRPISQAWVVEVDPPWERFIPPGSNARTQLALWNERDEEGKLRPHRAIRHAGSHADDLGEGGRPLGNWGDENGDGVSDLGFVCIGDTDYRIMLRYSEFNPVAIAGSQEQEPWRVGEAEFPPGLAAGDVPAYDRDGDGKPDATGFAGGGCHIYIVQFWTQSLPEFRDGMVAAGESGGGRVAVHNFLPHNSYIVELPDEAAAERIRELAYVRWVGAFHPAYRLDQNLLAQYFGPDGPPQDAQPVRYNFEVFERGMRQKAVVARRVADARGEVHEFDGYGCRLWATIDRGQVVNVLHMNEISFVDLWGLPQEDMDIAREISGANFLVNSTSLPSRDFRGQGVRGEIMDGGVFAAVGDNPPVTHEAFRSGPGEPGVVRHGTEPDSDSLAHGTATYGIAFGTGVGQMQARGMLYAPDAVGIFATNQRLIDFKEFFGGTISREQHVSELVEETGPYRAVFQSNSWGTNPATNDYTTLSKEVDNILFEYDLLMVKSHGNQPSGPRAESWCKNIVSVGGLKHHDTLSRSDDRWGGLLPDEIYTHRTGHIQVPL